jgi:hypothetical protein
MKNKSWPIICSLLLCSTLSNGHAAEDYVDAYTPGTSSKMGLLKTAIMGVGLMAMPRSVDGIECKSDAVPYHPIVKPFSGNYTIIGSLTHNNSEYMNYGSFCQFHDIKDSLYIHKIISPIYRSEPTNFMGSIELIPISNNIYLKNNILYKNWVYKAWKIDFCYKWSGMGIRLGSFNLGPNCNYPPPPPPGGHNLPAPYWGKPERTLSPDSYTITIETIDPTSYGNMNLSISGDSNIYLDPIYLPCNSTLYQYEQYNNNFPLEYPRATYYDLDVSFTRILQCNGCPPYCIPDNSTFIPTLQPTSSVSTKKPTFTPSRLTHNPTKRTVAPTPFSPTTYIGLPPVVLDPNDIR